MAPIKIKVPTVEWVLGDAEQMNDQGRIVTRRPLYHYSKAAPGPIRVGAIDPAYAEPLMTALEKK